MKEIKHTLRKAYLDRLASLSYMGKSIPVDQDFLNGEPALLPIGNSTQVEAYVIIQNQTVTDESAFCNTTQGTTLQLDVVTVFNANSGNSYHSEMIAQKIFDLLFTTSTKRIIFTSQELPDLNMWRGWYETGRALVQETSDKKIFRNVLIFQHSITQ